jgi:O-antigen/teichoic acid export membrane protein
LITLRVVQAPPTDLGGGRVPFAGFRQVENGLVGDISPAPSPAAPRVHEPAFGQSNSAPTSAAASEFAAGAQGSVPRTERRTAPEPANQTPGVQPNEDHSAASSSAVQTASSLGSSLLITAAIGFILQIFASKILGPEETGRVGTAEGVAAICLGLLSLGFDTYVRREVAIRPSHAKEFVPGAIFVRAVLSIPVALLVAVLLPVFGKPAKVVAIFLVFALAKFVTQTNEMLAACLHAVGRVKGIATQNLVSKLFGAVTLLVLIAAKRGGISLPVGVLVGEAVKLIYLSRRVGAELGVWSRVRSQEIRPVLKRSLPFISTVLITSFTMFLDVTLLGFLVNDKEVGYYRFGQQLVMIAYVVGTVLPWVVLPLASRAATQSKALFEGVARNAFQAAMVLGGPMALMVFLHADTIVNLADKAKFAPTVGSLRVISLMIPVTYLASLGSTLLQAQGRMWIIVRVGIGVAVLDGILVLMSAKWGLRHYGPGGSGITAAWSMLIAESLGTIVLLSGLGWHLWNREILGPMVRTAGSLLPVVLLEVVLRRIGVPGLLRILIEALLMVANGFLLRVVDLDMVKSFLPGRGSPPSAEQP